MLGLDYFLARPEKAWPAIKEIFYDSFGRAKPNKAKEVLAALENQGAGPDGKGLLQVLITQNIDSVQWN